MVEEQNEFAVVLTERIRAARAALRAAAGTNDSAAVAAALDDLESALHLARENGVEAPPAEEGADREEAGS